MDMFVTNPAKDILSSFFSTIVSEVKGALMAAFKVLVKLLCIRVVIGPFDVAGDNFVYTNTKRPLNFIKTIEFRIINYSEAPYKRTHEREMFPLSGLFFVHGILCYIDSKSKSPMNLHDALGIEFPIKYETFIYIPRWSKKRFENCYKSNVEEYHRNKRSRNFEIDSLPVNKNIMNELRIVDRWSRSMLWFYKRKIPFTYGIVLYGPPGSGKSTIVKYISELTTWGIELVNLRGSCEDFKKSITDRQYRVLLIEDIDAVFHGRTNVCNPQGLDFSTFINALSGVSSRDDRILVITTNKPELLDEALAHIPAHGEPVPRPGRIDRVIYVGPLEPEARLKVAQRVLPDRPDLWNDLVLAGEGEVIANFQARCVRVAMDLKWAELQNTSDT